MHDEFERAMTGRPARSGLSPLGWVLAGAGLLVGVGVVGAGVVAYEVAHRIEHVRDQLGAAPQVVVSNLAARIAQVPELVSMDPERGVDMLSNLDDPDVREGFLRSFMGTEFRMPDGSAHPDAPEAPVVPAVPDVPAPPEAPAFDGNRHTAVTADGGSVHISSDRGDVAISLRRSGDGGFLTIDSDQGRVRFDLRGDEDGGHLRISSNDGDVDIALGHNADAEPGWLDGLYAVPSGAEPVLSLSADDASLGAVAWESDEAPGDVLIRAQGALEHEGYEVRVRDSFRQGDVEHAALWARNEADGRMVFVVAHREDGRTGTLLGYGEKR